jgi:non-reducing end alpha-L-arabinofuranosidase
VNLQTDITHCGTCTTTCSASNNQTCTAGACVCVTGQTSCSGTCKNLQTDAANCGTCGMACGSGQTCSAGTCACPAGQTSCSGTCKNLQTDAGNCGTCGKACSTGQTCTAGACTGGTTTFTGPCDILAAAGNTCAAAHSTVRALYGSYTGSLYQVCKGSFTTGPNSCKGTTMDIGVVAGGYANAAAQDTFCAGSTCTISIIYDQSPNGSHLQPSPAGQHGGVNNPASATALKLTLNGHEAYGVQILKGLGYRSRCTGCGVGLPVKGTATGDSPETEYMVTSQNGKQEAQAPPVAEGCCFDYGNAETDSNDDNDGTMEAVYYGGGVSWDFGSTGVRTNSFVMADLENGLFSGFSTTNPSNTQTISTNTPLQYNYVTAVVVGDTAAQNSGKGRFALYGADATTGAVKTMYDGIRPTLAGYVPMKKQGSIILGTGGDNSNTGTGEWFEGVMASGAATLATVNAVQANIVAAGYGK